MSKYVTKNVVSTSAQVKVFNLNTKEIDSLTMVFNGKFNEKTVEKAVKNMGHKYIKTMEHHDIDSKRKVLTETFMKYAHKLTADDSKANLVTRTITTTKSIVKCYNLETDEVEEREFPVNVNNVDKLELAGYVPLEVVKRIETQTLYGLSLSTFINISEPA